MPDESSGFPADPAADPAAAGAVVYPEQTESPAAPAPDPAAADQPADAAPASAMVPPEHAAADAPAPAAEPSEAVSEPPADNPLNIPAEGVQPWLREALHTLHHLITKG